ncbi:MAG TPA: hypothetical protein PKX00_23975, partial [Opitutaceae bacterium]|nr:hypothetical protein [Opitutaceae bacterium]
SKNSAGDLADYIAGLLNLPFDTEVELLASSLMVRVRGGVAPFTWVHGGGGSDGNFVSAGGLPNLDGIGPIGDQLHSDREFCRVSTIAPRAQIVALVLHRIATGEIVLPTRTKT